MAGKVTNECRCSYPVPICISVCTGMLRIRKKGWQGKFKKNAILVTSSKKKHPFHWDLISMQPILWLKSCTTFFGWWDTVFVASPDVGTCQQLQMPTLRHQPILSASVKAGREGWGKTVRRLKRLPFQKERIVKPNHPFSGAKLLVSGRL